jgi:zinc/manganese transport system substrate-binding protein
MSGPAPLRTAAPLCAAALALITMLCGCTRSPARGAAAGAARPTVLALETFLADLTRQVAGDRVEVASLIPPGVEPHSFEPAPRDMARMTHAALIIANGAGLETFLGKLVGSPGSPGAAKIVEASAGLAGRAPREGEAVEGGGAPGGEIDPHFYLDPILVIRYVENIRDALGRLDPAGAELFSRNARAYTERLRELDREIAAVLSRVPAADRMLVTNHESLGYFADRYGLAVVGTVIPSVSTESSPTARQVARLVDRLKAVKARAVFLETGANAQLARQVAAEAGVPVVTELYTHALSDAGGPAPDYLQMMRYNARTVAAALAGDAPPGGAAKGRG